MISERVCGGRKVYKKKRIMIFNNLSSSGEYGGDRECVVVGV